MPASKHRPGRRGREAAQAAEAVHAARQLCPSPVPLHYKRPPLVLYLAPHQLAHAAAGSHLVPRAAAAAARSCAPALCPAVPFLLLCRAGRAALLQAKVLEGGPASRGGWGASVVRGAAIGCRPAAAAIVARPQPASGVAPLPRLHVDCGPAAAWLAAAGAAGVAAAGAAAAAAAGPSCALLLGGCVTSRLLLAHKLQQRRLPRLTGGLHV